VSVDLNEKRDVYEATFSNLGIKQVLVDADTVKRHPKLLVGGVWCIADLSYEYSDDRNAVPWILDSVKPIQLSSFDLDGYLAVRREFTTDEWIDLIVQSIGFNPEFFGRRAKLMQLVRLIPYCERNYNLIELGPKGTGKSHIYSEFSPHGILISGGEVSVAKLFVNNSNGRIGLVGYWDVVAFDEFAGKKKRADKALVDILKNYMANKSFSRGIETLGAEASMTFVGNTQHTLPFMLKHSDLFDDLPEQYHDSAFLDRLHFYIPGWEVDIIRGEMFSAGYGFVVDYLAEILRNLRNHDFSHLYRDHFELFADL
jgi:ATP-dependent Lon protease